MTEHDDKAFMLDPVNWPRWPVLPVKRYDSVEAKRCGVEIGIMRAISGEIGTTIYLVGMYSLKTGTDFSELPKKIYGNVDELLADGWIVD